MARQRPSSLTEVAFRLADDLRARKMRAKENAALAFGQRPVGGKKQLLESISQMPRAQKEAAIREMGIDKILGE